jgi:2-(1,2-epoxy-1,2-dihydrophenyl)acetyl-CoA isomerase
MIAYPPSSHPTIERDIEREMAYDIALIHPFTTMEPAPSHPPSPLLFTRVGNVVTLTLNRPAVLNAIDLQLCKELHKQLVQVGQDPTVRAVILSGAGRAFCAGGDLRFALAANPKIPGDSFLALTRILHACIAEIRTMSKPVIAAINGPAAGAGLFLALACDLRVMADTAYLKQSNTSYGLSLPAGGTFMLPRLVGLARALEIVMLDERIPAARSLELGLVNRVVAEDALLAETHKLARRVMKMPVGVLGQVKRLLNDSFWSTLEEQLHSERQAIALSANSAEGREGLAAFLEKRTPNFLAAGGALDI